MLRCCCCADDVDVAVADVLSLAVITKKNIHIFFILLIPMLKYFFAFKSQEVLGPNKVTKNITKKWLPCPVIWDYHDFWRKLR